MSRAAPLSCLSLLLVLCAASWPAAAAPDLPIYRCTDTRGQLTLSDSPCPSGQRQETRIMQRPQDPPPRAAAPASSSPPRPLPATATQIIVRTPMQPMYECVTSEGQRYTSDNDDGNPRLVPLWALGYPSLHGRPGHAGFVPYGSTWVRDECHALPPQEMCARLSDRRYEIMRRYNSALQSERRELELEQRGIEARMANDCGNG